LIDTELHIPIKRGAFTMLKRSKIKKVLFTIEKPLLREMDKCVKRGHFASRSAFIRHLVNSYIAENIPEEIRA
jgi:metal-responsive CopG/Arc/MetJ family transcriptional regulator